tara:strand:- start:131 stop:313 length:183 start_codon:yes stop_codon:yes gene_type:complete
MKLNIVYFVDGPLSHEIFYKSIAGTVINNTSDSFFLKTKDSHVKVTEFDGRIEVGDRFEN